MAFQDDDAVTPVVGTVLILLITMAGMSAILAWGVPTVQGIQDQSSVSAMQGEFSDIRLNTLILQEVDTSRLAFVALSAGELALEPGDRFAIHAVHNQTYPGGGTTNAGCDVRVTGWHATTDNLDVEVDSCGTVVSGSPSATQLEFKLDKLVGSSIQSRPGILVTGGGSSWNVESTKAGDDLSVGNWRVQLIDSDGTAHVQVFILATDRLAWHLQTSVSDMDLFVEGGALWFVDEPLMFNLAPMPVNENVFGTKDYLLNFVTYTGDRVTLESPSNPDIFLKLLGNHGRVSGLDTMRLRYDVHGELAEAWCNHLQFRTDIITVGTYVEDASATCETGDANGVRSVVYEPTGGGVFPFEFIHKRVHAGITV